MKQTTSTNSPLVPIMTGIGTWGIASVAFALTPAIWPISLLFAPLLWCAARHDVARAVDSAVASGNDELADEWKDTKSPDERVLEISRTLDSGGIINLPMTRTYRYIIDDGDIKRNDERVTNNALVVAQNAAIGRTIKGMELDLNNDSFTHVQLRQWADSLPVRFKGSHDATQDPDPAA